MNINTKAPLGALAISALIIVSFSIGIDMGKKMAAKSAPVEQAKPFECNENHKGKTNV